METDTAVKNRTEKPQRDGRRLEERERRKTEERWPDREKARIQEVPRAG